MLLLEEQFAGFINDGDSSIAASLGEASLCKLPHLRHGVKYLDGRQVRYPVVPAHYVEHAVDDDRRGVATRGVHICHSGPLPEVGVVSLDAATDVRTVVTPDCVQEIIHDSDGCPTSSLDHALDVGPLVSARVVALDRVEAETSDSVVATHRVEVAVHDGHTHTGTRGAHWCHVHPLLGVCMCVCARVFVSMRRE